MTERSPVQQLQKLARIWSERREKQIAVRIHYDLREENGCKIYSLSRIEELE